MQIDRRGVSSDHGLKSVSIDSPAISWNGEEQVIEIRQSGLSDFAGTATHDYTIKLPLPDIKLIVEMIGEELTNEVPDVISKAFSPSLRQIIRIARTCIES